MRALQPTAIAMEDSPASTSSVAPASEILRSARGRSRVVRVSVRTSVRDPNLLLVRMLADGDEVPRGAREAFLELPEARDTLVDADVAGVAGLGGSSL